MRVVIVRVVVDGVLGVMIVVLIGHDEVLVFYVAIFVVMYSLQLLGLRDWHVHNLYGGELLYTLMWKHFDGFNSLFLYPLHNLNLWNFLKNNMRLYGRNDLFLTDSVAPVCVKIFQKRKSTNNLSSLDSRGRKLRVHQTGEGIVLLDLGDWHVHNVFGSELCHALMWKHFDGFKNLFLYPLHNRNLRNFLNDHLFLHSWVFH